MVLTATILFSLMMSLSNVAAQGESPQMENLSQNQYQGELAGNETNQFMFQNKFQFQIRTNQSIDLEMDVDVDAVGEREFELELNCSEENLKLEVQIRASNDELGLTNGSAIQHQNQNQNQYMYQEQFTVNLTLNEDCELQARLRIDTDDENAKWAYFDEDAEEFVIVESQFQNGVLTAETNHFSTWTLLTIEPDDGLSIAGYSALGGLFAVSTLGILFYYRRRQ